MIFIRIISVSFLLFGLVQISNAQMSKGTIFVKVYDPLGDLITDAEITLLKDWRIEKLIKTDNRGVAQFHNLIDGEYRINIVATNFKKIESAPIVIRNGNSQTIEVKLEISTIESKVEVGNDEADIDRFGVNRILNEKDIEKLPDNPEDFERALRQLVGPSLTGEALPITVDGFENGKIPPKEMIKQIRVNQNVFSAQYEGQFGGGIEIFTKSDVENFSGSVGFGFTDSRLNAANPFIGVKIPAQTRNYQINIAGPLMRKKASFIFNITRSESDTGSPINAIILDSFFTPIQYKQFFASPSRSESAFFSIKADLTKEHKVIFNYGLTNSRSYGQGITNFSLPSQAYNTDNQNHIVQISDTFLANENIVSQTRFQLFLTKNKSFGGSNEAAINVLDAFSGGGSQVDSSRDDLRLEFSNDTTWQIGKYGLGVGGRIRGQYINQISQSNYGGTFNFSGRIAPVLDANNNPVIDNAGNFVTTQINSLESYRRTLLFQSLGLANSQIRILGGGASQFSISGGNPEVSVKQHDIALYIQNSYKVSQTTAVSFGIRYENQTNIKDNLNFAPRFGIVWSPKSNEKKNPLFTLPRISFGMGLFYSRFGINNLLNVRQTNSDGRSQYLLTNPSVLDFYPNVPSITLLEQFALPKNKRLIDTEIQIPVRSLVNINLYKKMPLKFSVNFTYSHTENFRQILTRNINAPLAGTFNFLNPNEGVYPLGKSAGLIYRTFSGGKRETDFVSVGLGIPSYKFLQTQFYYTFFKAKDNLINGSGSPFDAYDFSQEFGRGDNTHRVTFSTVSNNLPLGFSISNFFSFATGSRFDIITGRDTNGDGFYNERPAFASDMSKPNLIETKYGVLDPVPSLTDTIIPRNLGIGPSIFNLDTSINRSFVFGAKGANKTQSRYRLTLSVYIRNVLNINNQGNPVGNMSSPYFLRHLSYAGGSGNIISTNVGTFTESGGRSFNLYTGFSF